MSVRIMRVCELINHVFNANVRDYVCDECLLRDQVFFSYCSVTRPCLLRLSVTPTDRLTDMSVMHISWTTMFLTNIKRICYAYMDYTLPFHLLCLRRAGLYVSLSMWTSELHDNLSWMCCMSCCLLYMSADSSMSVHVNSTSQYLSDTHGWGLERLSI